MYWNLYGSEMDIEILYVPDCPNLDRAVVRVLEALDQTGLSASVHESEVASVDVARARGMRGSPTVLIDGRDPFGSDDVDGSMSCRLYRFGAGVDGAPSVEQLVDVLTVG